MCTGLGGVWGWHAAMQGQYVNQVCIIKSHQRHKREVTEGGILGSLSWTATGTLNIAAPGWAPKSGESPQSPQITGSCIRIYIRPRQGVYTTYRVEVRRAPIRNCAQLPGSQRNLKFSVALLLSPRTGQNGKQHLPRNIHTSKYMDKHHDLVAICQRITTTI